MNKYVQQQQQQHSLFSQASWGRLEMKHERNKFKVQAQIQLQIVENHKIANENVLESL